jgi:hypothetical protein
MVDESKPDMDGLDVTDLGPETLARLARFWAPVVESRQRIQELTTLLRRREQEHAQVVAKLDVTYLSDPNQVALDRTRRDALAEVIARVREEIDAERKRLAHNERMFGTHTTNVQQKRGEIARCEREIERFANRRSEFVRELAQ